MPLRQPATGSFTAPDCCYKGANDLLLATDEERYQLKVRMSHGLLADSVDTILASLLYSSTTVAVFSEVHDQ